jgi:hypothetical protein
MCAACATGGNAQYDNAIPTPICTMINKNIKLINCCCNECLLKLRLNKAYSNTLITTTAIEVSR